MNKKTKKIISIALITTLVCSFLTITCASVISENYSRMLNNDSFNKLEKLGKTENSKLQAKTADLQTEPANEQKSIEVTAENSNKIPVGGDTQSYEIPEKPLNLKKKSTMRTMSTENSDASQAIDYTEAQITQHRQEKLAALQEKYPAEYQYITSTTGIDPYFYVSLLERIDMWLITDLEEYIGEYIQNGFEGLEQYHTTLRMNRGAENE